MLETRAPVERVHQRFYELRERLFEGELGTALRAWYWGIMLGLPTRLHDALQEAALRARDHHAAGDRARFQDDLAELHRLLAEAEGSYGRWKATGAVVDATPDLVVEAAAEVRGD
jgi:hypothetical protein